jgi:hypothetical protein
MANTRKRGFQPQYWCDFAYHEDGRPKGCTVETDDPRCESGILHVVSSLIEASRICDDYIAGRRKIGQE